MKETFDELIWTLDKITISASNTSNLSVLNVCRIIKDKVLKLQEKYNEGLQKEPVAAKSTEMTALEYLKEKARMCDSAGDCSCTGCLIHIRKGTMMCVDFQQKCPEQAISAVQQWSKEHPSKTILQDFLAKYPKAIMEDGGFPEPCPYHLGYEKEPTNNDEFCDAGEDGCRKCWNRPLDEVK